MPLQHCGHEGAHACLVSWFCGKAQTQFADIQMVFTHHVVFVMFNKIENPALWNAVCNLFLETFILYGEQSLSSSIVLRWVWLFTEGRENVRDNLWSGWLSVVNEDLVRAVEEKIRENRKFAITSLPAFPSNFTVTAARNCVW